jgi:hypothetical protein
MVDIKGLNTLKVQKYYEKVKRRRKANMERRKEIINKLKEMDKDEQMDTNRESD